VWADPAHRSHSRLLTVPTGDRRARNTARRSTATRRSTVARRSTTARHSTAARRRLGGASQPCSAAAYRAAASLTCGKAGDTNQGVGGSGRWVAGTCRRSTGSDGRLVVAGERRSASPISRCLPNAAGQPPDAYVSHFLGTECRPHDIRSGKKSLRHDTLLVTLVISARETIVFFCFF
jgi:hypothetical protein